MRTNHPSKGLGQVPEETEIEGERTGGGGGEREEEERRDPPQCCADGKPSAWLGLAIQAIPEGPSQKGYANIPVRTYLAGSWLL